MDDHRLTLHAYCWMPNHIHLALQVSDQSLARPMQRLACRHARRMQWGMETTGHFFERRYHAVIVDSERYLLTLVRYIHLNPVRAALVARPEEFEWSSYRAYLGGSRPSWLTTSGVLGRLSGDEQQARIALVKLTTEAPTDEELAYLRRRSDRNSGHADASTCQTKGLRATAPTLDSIITDECSRLGITAESLAGATSGRLEALARARIAWRAVASGAAKSLSELAPRLNRSVSAISEGLRIQRRRHPELFKLPKPGEAQ